MSPFLERLLHVPALPTLFGSRCAIGKCPAVAVSTQCLRQSSRALWRCRLGADRTERFPDGLKWHAGLPIMSPAQVKVVLVAAACLGIASCMTVPAEDRARLFDSPLVSAHSEIAFAITTGSRQGERCGAEASCPTPAEAAAAMSFARQVQRVSDALQVGARYLYPDLQRRAPGLVAGRFEVYVVDGEEPGSASSANGKIALNAGFAAWQPYDDWLAFVIAREMGHVIGRHHEENSVASIAASVLLNVFIPGSSFMKSAISAGGAGIAARSKAGVQARAADTIALSLLKAAGFRLRNVSIALLTAPVVLDGGEWSNNFRASSDYLLAEARRTEFAVAAAVWEPQVWRPPATAPGK